MTRWGRELAFWTVTAAALGLGIVLVLVMSGRLVADPAPPATEAPPPTATERPAATSAPATEPEPESESDPEPAPAPKPEPRPTSATRPAKPQTVAVTIAASRGDCWVSARRGAETGAVLFEGLLIQGETVEVEAPRVWLLLGASANVDVSVDGKDVALPAGTVEAVMPLPQRSS